MPGRHQNWLLLLLLLPLAAAVLPLPPLLVWLRYCSASRGLDSPLASLQLPCPQIGIRTAAPWLQQHDMMEADGEAHSTLSTATVMLTCC